MDIRDLAFRYRSYTPIPFLVLMMVFAEPTVASLAGGAALGLLGEAVRFWGVSIAGSETRTRDVGGTYLITRGPFAHVRNPLYVGNILLYAGVSIMANALVPWLLAGTIAFFVVQYSLIVDSEERYLARTFGQAYEEYRRNVPRFVPRILPYRDPSPSPKAFDVAAGFASERRTLQAIVVIAGILLGIYLFRG